MACMLPLWYICCMPYIHNAARHNFSKFSSLCPLFVPCSFSLPVNVYSSSSVCRLLSSCTCVLLQLSALILGLYSIAPPLSLLVEYHATSVTACRVMCCLQSRSHCMHPRTLFAFQRLPHASAVLLACRVSRQLCYVAWAVGSLLGRNVLAGIQLLRAALELPPARGGNRPCSG